MRDVEGRREIYMEKGRDVVEILSRKHKTSIPYSQYWT